jgi:hypothetical protein
MPRTKKQPPLDVGQLARERSEIERLAQRTPRTQREEAAGIVCNRWFSLFEPLRPLRPFWARPVISAKIVA